MSNKPNILELLESFFSKRKSPDELVKKGILESPAVIAPGSGDGKFFNKYLSDVPQTEGIPSLVVSCCTHIENNNGMKEEGLFRVPGSSDEIKTITQEFDGSGSCNLSGFEISSVAGVLKFFFRVMPEPLFTFSHYQKLMDVAKANSMDEDALISGLSTILYELPPENSRLAVYLFTFLKFCTHALQKCSLYYEDSKMNVDNLAMVFAPNVLRPETETLKQIMEDSGSIKVVLRTLINNADALSA